MSTHLTWVGHATVLMDFSGVRVLTDPTLKRRVAHLRRRTPIPPDSVTDVDMVLISHIHMDHLHLPSLTRVERQVPVVVPRGAGELVAAKGFADVTEVSPGDRLVVAGLDIEVVPAAHVSGRGPHTSLSAEPLGYVAGDGRVRVYFAGDTDLFEGMADLGALEAAFLPIWGWGPTLGEGHLDPERAVEATRLIEPRFVIPMHWGTYTPQNVRPGPPGWIDDAVARFSKLLTDTEDEKRLRVLEPGGSLWLQ
jgi:L-ascorbate metabolism protein UlaG (beta-lactamase superfamily)